MKRTSKPAAAPAAPAPAPASVSTVAVHPDVPLYQRVAQSLREGIESGFYALGSDLPTETELCEQFAVSRHTVREAVRRLVDIGYVERRQGSGTRVVSASPKVSYVHAIKSLAELFQYTRETELDIESIGQATINETDAAELGVPPGSRWLRIDGLRHTTSQNELVCYSHVLVHLRFAHLEQEIRDTKGPIYALLEARTPETVAGTVQEISARPMTAQVGKALGLRAGAPALCIARRYLDASGGAMLVNLNWHPAGRFTYVMHLKRDA